MYQYEPPRRSEETSFATKFPVLIKIVGIAVLGACSVFTPTPKLQTHQSNQLIRVYDHEPAHAHNKSPNGPLDTGRISVVALSTSYAYNYGPPQQIGIFTFFHSKTPGSS